MASATIQEHDPQLEEAPESSVTTDPRWQLAQRIAGSEQFQKSTRLPKLLLYLARYTLAGDRHKLTEQIIGQTVFGKRQYFDPAEDSSVRVNVRQLRLKLHEYYQTPGLQEDWIVSLPKGGYVLEFTPASAQGVRPQPPETAVETTFEPSKSSRELWLAAACVLLLIAAAICAIGWRRASTSHTPVVPWPLNAVLQPDAQTNLVIADVGTSLRMLGGQEITLDDYIRHDYLQPILPKHMTAEEAGLFHYLDSTRITSEADANAAAVLSSIAGPLSGNIAIRSARDINANDLTHGDFIFVGSKNSNPWVELVESRMDFQVFEDGPHGARYIINRHPQAGEQNTYKTTALGTLASGEDYAVIALVPAKTGNGSWLLLEGVRMEGTNAAISLLKTSAGREKLESKLASLHGGHTPKYFEALLHSQSVAGATMSVDVIAARSIVP